MSKCRYDLSEDCNNTDCLNCVLDKIRAEIERLHYHPKLDFIKNDEVVEMALDIINKYIKAESEGEK